MWFRHLLFDLFGMYEDEFQYWAIDEANKRVAAYYACIDRSGRRK